MLYCIIYCLINVSLINALVLLNNDESQYRYIKNLKEPWTTQFYEIDSLFCSLQIRNFVISSHLFHFKQF